MYNFCRKKNNEGYFLSKQMDMSNQDTGFKCRRETAVIFCAPSICFLVDYECPAGSLCVTTAP